MPYIGNQPAEQFTSFATQEFSTSATTSYTLDHAVTNENEIALFINNVRQQPGSGKAYTATGTALTLSAATASTDTMYCVFLGRALQTVNPATNSITTAMISDDAVTAAKISASLGKLGQVVQTVDTTNRSSTSSSFVSTGVEVSITPSATSSKVLLLCDYSLGIDTDARRNHTLTFYRDSTDLTPSGVNGMINCVMPGTNATYHLFPQSMSFLDSPSSTSSITYKLMWKINGDTHYLGRKGNNTDQDAPSILTAMEILA